MTKKNGIKPKNCLVVGFAYDKIPMSASPEERDFFLTHGEWDNENTINEIIKSIEAAGSKVIELPVYPYPDERQKSLSKNEDFYYRLIKYRPEIDIVFNLAEGFKTKNREAIVPAILESLHIPFTGSDACALSTALNKADTIEILSNYGLNMAPFQVFKKKEDIDSLLRYTKRLEKVRSLIVKPIGEGTSIGMSQDSVIDFGENTSLELAMLKLRTCIENTIDQYIQPAMVQQFLDGPEYSVGILGDLILPILKINLEAMPNKPKIRDPAVKWDDARYILPEPMGEDYLILAAHAATAHVALGCRDYNRFDFRKDNRDGKIYFLEANPLPGIDPQWSHFPIVCKMAGIPYECMINNILYRALTRYKEEKGFSERFSAERIEYIHQFISPVINNLDTYPGSMVPDDERVNTAYKYVKIKKDAVQEVMEEIDNVAITTPLNNILG